MRERVNACAQPRAVPGGGHVATPAEDAAGGGRSAPKTGLNLGLNGGEALLGTMVRQKRLGKNGWEYPFLRISPGCPEPVLANELVVASCRS